MDISKLFMMAKIPCNYHFLCSRLFGNARIICNVVCIICNHDENEYT